MNRSILRLLAGLLVCLGQSIQAQTFSDFRDLPFIGATAAQSAGQIKAANWATRVVANGGADPTGAETVALATFWDGLVTDGLDTLMIHINHISPASKIAYTTPFLVGGGNDPWVARCGNNHTTTLDLTVNGAAGAGGNSITEDTGIIDTTAYASDNDGGMVLYVYTQVNEGVYDAGYQNDALTTAFSLVTNSGGLAVANCRSQVVGAIAVAPGGTLQGFWSMQRTANTVFNLYFANSGTAHASVGSSAVGESGARQAQAFYAFGVHAIDHGAVCTGFGNPTKRFSFYALTKGLSSGQDNNLFNRVQTLRTSLGGGQR